ncbi:unnamed protein product [Spirodela intermedia]|uniref:Rhodanese domain-containing protein n=1 Tax=Spirodela intermedia TaxID=51605 RepID=A0A7I8IQS5_SPIIN|nr:unnamed protein product [Spirodela intermedia]CAA6660290.1 unnamed protein product [Spirodela intermedia]
MLPFVCSASLSCSSQFPIFAFLVMESPECPSSTDSSIFSPYPNYYDDIVRGFSNENSDSLPDKWSCSTKEISTPYSLDADLNRTERGLQLDSVDFLSSNGGNVTAERGSETITAEPLIPQNVEVLPAAPPSGDVLLNLGDSYSETSNALSEPAISGSLSISDSTVNIIPENADAVSKTFEVHKDDVSNLKENVEHLLAGIRDSTTASLSNAQSAVENRYDALVSSVMKTVDNQAHSIENAISNFLSAFDKSKEQADNKLTVISSNMRGNFYEAGGVAAEMLRKAIISFESFLSDAGTFIVYSYESSKPFLPPELRDTISTAEGKLLKILIPIGTALQKVYLVIEGLERTLGIDPNDPLVQFTLILAGSATFGVSYWLILYGGYSGDLSPELTFELLSKDENVVLVDIRPEDVRERDGVPDLRRRARSKYASVNPPEVDGSLRTLLRSVGEVNDALTALIIRNLKIVKDGSKVILLDASGDQSKGIARSLRKLGVQKPYLVQGGFRSWVKSGLRIKELKPETALDIINEDAAEIIQEIRPTPGSVFGYGLGAAATLYALLEWEKTLQLIGVIGLGQSLYRRVSSYESSEDLKADVRLLLTPVALGAQVLSRAAGNSDPAKIGLPTSPSSTAVQDRVLQAAAKHESQPTEAEEAAQVPPVESASAATDGLDLSEA